MGCHNNLTFLFQKAITLKKFCFKNTCFQSVQLYLRIFFNPPTDCETLLPRVVGVHKAWASIPGLVALIKPDWFQYVHQVWLMLEEAKI